MFLGLFGVLDQALATPHRAVRCCCRLTADGAAAAGIFALVVAPAKGGQPLGEEQLEDLARFIQAADAFTGFVERNAHTLFNAPDD